MAVKLDDTVLRLGQRVSLSGALMRGVITPELRALDDDVTVAARRTEIFLRSLSLSHINASNCNEHQRHRRVVGRSCARTFNADSIGRPRAQRSTGAVRKISKSYGGNYDRAKAKEPR